MGKEGELRGIGGRISRARLELMPGMEVQPHHLCAQETRHTLYYQHITHHNDTRASRTRVVRGGKRKKKIQATSEDLGGR